MSTRFLQRRIGLLIVLLILVLIFAVQNAALIEVQILRWIIHVRRSVLIVVLLLIGCTMGWYARAIYRMLTGVTNKQGVLV